MYEVMIPIGGSAELLTYFPNKGEWMLHCHIAEHLGSGMMTSITAV
jgi:FtsP/CotA-like multicopper oxidase with cupredoxin domain